jgi:hypothetical protein
MAGEDIRMLVEAIVDYLEWERSMKATGIQRPLIGDSFALIDFLRFTTQQGYDLGRHVHPPHPERVLRV